MGVAFVTPFFLFLIKIKFMMPPKEKARQLIEIYYDCMDISIVDARETALITVDEILDALSVPPIQNKGHLLYDGQIDYWNQVKQEIENTKK